MSEATVYLASAFTLVACALLPPNEMELLFPGSSSLCGRTTESDVVQQASVESVITPTPSPVAPIPHDHSSGGHSHEAFRSSSVTSIPTHGPAVIIPVDTLVPDSGATTTDTRDVPLDVFTAAALSQVPSSVSPTGSPTTVEPTLVPTVTSSDAPSDTPTVAPTTAAPSDLPSDAPSDVPSSGPVAMVEEPSAGRAILEPETTKPTFRGVGAIFIPRPDDDDNGDDAVASTEIDQLGSDFPSMVPSDIPSMLPSDLPSTIPSDAPSIVPAVYDEGSESDAVVFMDANEIATFEQVCSQEFLVQYLPWVNMTECTDIVCEVVSQKEASVRKLRRGLQETMTEVEYNLGGIDVLIEVSCETDLPEDSDFASSVQRAFGEFGDEFEEDLKSKSDFFEFDAIQGSPSSGTGRGKSSRRAMALGITGGALVAGALLALSISFFALRRAREEEEEEDDLPTHMTVEPVVEYLKPDPNGGNYSFGDGPSFIAVGHGASRPPPVEIPPTASERKQEKESSSRLITEVAVTKETKVMAVTKEMESGTAREAEVVVEKDSTEPIDPPEGNNEAAEASKSPGGSSASGSCAKSPKSPICVQNKYCSPRKAEPEEFQPLSPDPDDSGSQKTDDAQDVLSTNTVATDAVLNPAAAGSPICAGAYDFFAGPSSAKSSNQTQLPYNESFSPSKSSRVSFKLDEDEEEDDDKNSGADAMETGTASPNPKVVRVEQPEDSDEDEVIPSSPRSRWLQGIFNRQKQSKAKKTRLQDQHDYESSDEEGPVADDENSELSSWKKDTADAEKVLTDLDQLVKKSDAMTPKQDNTAASKPFWNN